jgi:uncharacterized protein YjbI with pentapeptide repeats
MVMKKRQIRLLILLQFGILQQSTLAADFSGANLSGAHLTNADLRGSNLSGANLKDTNLSGTDLRDTNVAQTQLDGACGYGTKLPAGLRIRPCPASTASGLDTNGTGQRGSIDRALPEPHNDRDAPQQPLERIETSSSSGIEASFRAARQ